MLKQPLSFTDRSAPPQSKGSTAGEHAAEERAHSKPAPGAPRSPLLTILVEAGVLSRERASKIVEVARREGLPLAQILVRDGLVLSKDLATLVALHFGIPMIDLRSQAIDPQALAVLPEEVARKYEILPIKRTTHHLTVAMTDPTDLRVLQDLSARTGMALEPVVSTSEDIQRHIEASYRLTESLASGIPAGEPEGGDRLSARLLRDAPPAQVIDLLILQALQDRASDIHIEPAESRLRVRFRIDGILHDIMALPLDMHPALISRLKIISGMNIAERRKPQDGQLTFEAQNQKVDVRVAVSSTVLGEMAALRLLDKRFTLLGLGQLGMSPETLDRYRQMLRLPYGMVIVCGPTGAGKSTTLYASVLHANRTEQNVISIEDPVEYRIPDANQMQVHEKAGITFATQLRSILRLDPDVILVGEVRDQETASIAVQAALTGHLVLTSLHANDSVSALLRLRDLGIAPYLIASSVAAIIAQRMIRMVCTGCQTLVKRPKEEQEAYAAQMGELREQFVYGAGCNLCAHSGYRGRSGVFELLVPSDDLRQLFLGDAPRHQLWEQVLKEGFVPLRKECMGKVKQGFTTPYEVIRILSAVE